MELYKAIRCNYLASDDYKYHLMSNLNPSNNASIYEQLCSLSYDGTAKSMIQFFNISNDGYIICQFKQYLKVLNNSTLKEILYECNQNNKLIALETLAFRGKKLEKEFFLYDDYFYYLVQRIDYETSLGDANIDCLDELLNNKSVQMKIHISKMVAKHHSVILWEWFFSNLDKLTAIDDNFMPYRYVAIYNHNHIEMFKIALKYMDSNSLGRNIIKSSTFRNSCITQSAVIYFFQTGYAFDYSFLLTEAKKLNHNAVIKHIEGILNQV